MEIFLLLIADEQGHVLSSQFCSKAEGQHLMTFWKRPGMAQQPDGQKGVQAGSKWLLQKNTEGYTLDALVI